MANKAKTRETKYGEYIGIPVEREVKTEIASVAEQEERNPTDMARMLLKEALSARRESRQPSAAR